MNVLTIASIVLLLIYLVLYFVPIGLWYTARLSGVDVSIFRLMNMKYRKIHAPTILNALIILKKYDIKVDLLKLEELFLSGGNLKNVVNVLIKAKQLKTTLSFDQACEIDRKGIDIVKYLEAKAPTIHD